MTFNLSSQSFRDGDYLGDAHIPSKDFGIGCAGGNHSPQLSWSGAPRLPVNADTSAAVVGFNPNFNTLAKSVLMGLFKRVG